MFAVLTLSERSLAAALSMANSSAEHAAAQPCPNTPAKRLEGLESSLNSKLQQSYYELRGRVDHSDRTSAAG